MKKISAYHIKSLKIDKGTTICIYTLSKTKKKKKKLVLNINWLQNIHRNKMELYRKKLNNDGYK